MGEICTTSEVDPPHKLTWFQAQTDKVKPIHRQVSNIRRTFRQLNCWSLRCSWSIACRRCSNYIFILNLTHGFNRLGKDNCKTRRETFTFWDSVHLTLEIWWCPFQFCWTGSLRSMNNKCKFTNWLHHFSCQHPVKKIQAPETLINQNTVTKKYFTLNAWV